MLRRIVPEHLRSDDRLVREYYGVIVILISANVGTLLATWYLTVAILSAGLPDWLWAMFIAFTTITQITTWGIAIYTYYIAMLTRMTAVKAGATMTDVIKDFEKLRERLNSAGMTLDYLKPIAEHAEKEWKSLTQQERDRVINNIRKSISERLRTQSSEQDIPIPGGVIIGQDENRS